MKAVVAAFNQEKALVGASSVITNLRMELFEALVVTVAAVFGANHEKTNYLDLERRHQKLLVTELLTKPLKIHNICSLKTF